MFSAPNRRSTALALFSASLYLAAPGSAQPHRPDTTSAQTDQARELMLRCTPLRPGGWLFYLACAAALSFSAFFELIEWWAALAFGADADAFLATQGDVWDTQWDMFLCLCGAALSLLLWSRLHDRQLGLPR